MKQKYSDFFTIKKSKPNPLKCIKTKDLYLQFLVFFLEKNYTTFKENQNDRNLEK